jgi:hypothetical protein
MQKRPLQLLRNLARRLDQEAPGVGTFRDRESRRKSR